MRVAWVSPYLPAPENSGGRIRIANLVRAFEGHELHLYARLALDDPESIGELPPWRSIHARRAQWPRLPEVVVPALSRSFPTELKALLAVHDRERAFDAVIVEHSYSAYELPVFQRAAVVLAEHNVESEYWLRELRSRPHKLLKNSVAYLRWRHYESQVWRNADAIAVVSVDDQRQVQNVRPDTGMIIPNGIALENYRFIPPSGRTGRAILFVGLLSYNPNIEAARLLAERVLPLVQRHFPDATLTLAGRDPHVSLRRLASNSIRVTGTVLNIARVFDEHAAFANPIRFGAGSSLKVLEPLASGLPLVGSSFAVRGFELRPGAHYLQAETPEQIAAELCRVFADPSAFDAMASRSRRIAERYSWVDIREDFSALVRQTIDIKRRRAA
jgi:polysaccharide biosynthesis protein PslH